MSAVAQWVNAAFNGPRPPSPDLAAAPRRRTKIWETSPRWHCPLAGTCVPVADMRKLCARAGISEQGVSDYVLHVNVVSGCGSRTQIADWLQRFLDKRYAAAVARFAVLRGASAVLDRWHEALSTGHETAGALWAAWSHPDVTVEVGNTIYGDIHMTSHQIGAAVRAEFRQLADLRKDRARVDEEMRELQLTRARAQTERTTQLQELERARGEIRRLTVLLSTREKALADARLAASEFSTIKQRAEALALRAEAVEVRNAANADRAAHLGSELAETRAQLNASEIALAFVLDVADGTAGDRSSVTQCPGDPRLHGRCVLCVGGRTGSVTAYRRLVETQGGRFIHHDGGQEDNLHRIEAALSAADGVICQAGCISHAAYGRLKELCKKLHKPCIFLQSPGMTTFARGLAMLSGGAADGAVVNRLAN